MDNWTQHEFKDPPAKFRGAPFWAWNNRLDAEELKRQVGYFKEMGMGGFHIHCRVGLDTEYLSSEFMECVAGCVEEGKKQGLYTYLYDEDRWPSGAAGGFVTKEEAYRSRYLHFIPDGQETSNGILLAVYCIHLEEGCLANYEQVSEDAAGDDIWRLYLETAKPDPWFNNQTYVDTLNKEAIGRFIEITHESYAREFGDEFGTTIPSIFTDEPQFRFKETLNYAEEKKSLILPYTDKFEEFHRERYGESFIKYFPEIVWELPNGAISAARYRYHDGIAELFAVSFADVLYEWCQNHNLMLTGHLMEEPTLLSQTSALSEAMRSYRGFHMPGIDMLCDWREYTTAKQAQSAAHQFGRAEVLSELYGVTNWDFDFRSHKLQGDWQAALGVTRRVHHLSWVSMAGEAKRDYPASIFYQSPWYKEYKLVEDHFARVNTALMRGKPIVRVAVIHPIESYWLHFGPKEQTAQIREAMEQDFSNITEWLLFGMIDFDYLAESLLPAQNVHTEGGKLCVGDMKYDMVLICGCETLRSSTLTYLTDFKEQNGTIIFVGQEPKYVDVKESESVQLLAAKCIKIPMKQTLVLDALESVREVEIRKPDGTPADHFVYQMRQEENAKWLFLANGKKPKTHDIPQRISYQIKIKGHYDITVCDTQSGELYKKPVTMKHGWSLISQTLDIHDSLLLKMEVQAEDISPANNIELTHLPLETTIPQPDQFELNEPNVLLLDQCQYRIDSGDWQETEEILRIDNKLRELFGYPKRMESMPQPWVEKTDADHKHTVELLFTIFSETECKDVQLVLEEMEQAEVIWNGIQIEVSACGWYTDKSLKKMKLGTVQKGENKLMIKLPFGRKTNLEWCYLLGQFAVRAAGRTAVITAYPERLYFGDYTIQGLPFYGGNIKYQIPIQSEGASYRLQISKYRAPLIKVSIDGGEWKAIAYSPYEVDFGYLERGPHTLEIISYGNRVNTFGAVHNCDETLEWFGQSSWRTEGERFSYEYQLKRMGILKAPILYRYS